MMAIQPPFDVNAVLLHTNKYRSIHQAQDFVHDPGISKISQAWADQCAASNYFSHNRSGFGECLAKRTWSGNSADLSPVFMTSTVITNQVKSLIDHWYNEISLYNHNNPVSSMHTGNFTQLVWQSTIKVGVGVSYANRTLCVVMNYNPPGNCAGQFEVNVLPAKMVSSVPLK